MREGMRELLEREGFTVVDYTDVKSSVDYIAKRGKEILVVRVLGNLDALRPEHAEDLIKLAKLLGGKAFVVAERSRWRPLKEGVIYYRYGVPALSPETFRDYLRGRLPTSIYVKGREIVELDRELLRKRRKELGLSLQGLAELVGTTKETIYRYEHGHYATREAADKLEKVLGVKLVKRITPVTGSVEGELHFPFDVLRNLGGKVEEFSRLPWEAMGRGRLTITFLRGRSKSFVRRKVRDLERGKGRIYSYYLFIGSRVKGVPCIDEEEILEAKSFREIEKIARERDEESGGTG